MDFSWKFAIDAGAISLALLCATFLRARSRFLQRFVVPNALTAGFLLLPVYNFLFPLLGYRGHRLGDLVYHLLSVSFIAMILRPSVVRSPRAVRNTFGMAVGILSQYALQALFGLLGAYFMLSTFAPGLSPAFGLFVPLGYALGPGQAYAIGKGWEPMGFSGAASVGLAFAAIGYLWSSFIGVSLISWGVAKGWVSASAREFLKSRSYASGVVEEGATGSEVGRLTTDSEAIDSFSFHTALTAGTYLLSFLLLSGLTALLSLAGSAGRELGANFWGINFIFSSLTAFLVKGFLKRAGLLRLVDDGTMTRISGVAVDFMVAGAIAAIALESVASYWLHILLLSLASGILVTVTTIWTCSRLFTDRRFERMLMIYGCSTGTLSTGLALLRVLDPEFRSPVAADYMKSAGITFAAAIPFILSINLPAKAGQTGDMGYFWLMIAVAAAYLLVNVLAFFLVAGRRAFARPGTLWLPEADVPQGLQK